MYGMASQLDVKPKLGIKIKCEKKYFLSIFSQQISSKNSESKKPDGKSVTKICRLGSRETVGPATHL